MASNDVVIFDFLKSVSVPEEELTCTNEDIIRVYDKLKDLDVNLSYFIKNANGVKFIIDESLSKGRRDSTFYDMINNTIITSSKNYKNGITHECLHMGSNVVTPDGVLTGFLQENYSSKRKVGEALNEGYTTLLDERLFGKIISSDGKKEQVVYPITKQIVSDLEITLGSKPMLDSYFNADLYSIYNLLSKLMGRKRTMEFLYTLDALFYMGEYKMKTNPIAIRSFYPEIQMYISEAFYTKITDKYRNGSLSSNDYKKFLELVSALLAERIYISLIPISEDLTKYRSSLEESYERNYKIRQKNNCLVK